MKSPLRHSARVASVYLALAASVAASAEGPDPTVASVVKAARYEIVQRRYLSALDELSHLKQNAPNDAVFLTLRAIAEWGQALTLYGGTEKSAGDYSLSRLAFLMTRREAAGYSPSSAAGRIMAAALDVATAELASKRGAVATLPDKYGSADSLFEKAESDFESAAALPVRSRTEWCANINGWLLLSKAHRFVFWSERAQREKSASFFSRGGSAELSLLAPSETRLTDLRNELYKDLGQSISPSAGREASADLIHSAADALLLVSLTDNRMSSWAHRARQRRVTRASAEAGKKPREEQDLAATVDAAEVSLDRVKELLREDPTRALSVLYERCARSRNANRGPGPAYACYLLGVEGSQAGDMLDEAARLSPKDCAWVRLERTQNAVIEGASGQTVIQQLVTLAGLRGMDRPVFTSLPGPIRETFMRSPAASLMDNGPRFTGQFESISRLIQDAARSAPDDVTKAQYQGLRLRLAIQLTKSILPWDRWQGYSEAGSALSALSKIKGVFSDAQVASFASTAGRLEGDSKAQEFPSSGLYITDGQPLWIGDPYTSGKTALTNPTLFVASNGFFATSAPR